MSKANMTLEEAKNKLNKKLDEHLRYAKKLLYEEPFYYWGILAEAKTIKEYIKEELK